MFLRLIDLIEDSYDTVQKDSFSQSPATLGFKFVVDV